MTKVVVVHDQPVGSMMAGPSVRYFELSTALAKHFDVTLAVPEVIEAPPGPFRLVTYQVAERESLLPIARKADAILVSWLLLTNYPDLGRLGRPLIVDIYIPSPLEDLERHRQRPIKERVKLIDEDFARLRVAARTGDFFICGNERQRDFWLGLLGSVGRLNPLTYEHDPTYRGLIDVVSMGIPEAPPELGINIKSVIPGLNENDFLLVWPGGLWDWLDPLTAIEAVHRVVDKASDVKLLFPGLRHPQPQAIAGMKNPDGVLDRAKKLGLLGYHVFFSEWTPYADRASYLVSADAALSLHFDSVETHFAIRVRLLDCIWSATPMIATRGDPVGQMLAERGLAKLVPPRDPDAVAEAILGWRAGRDDRARLAETFDKLALQYRWSSVIRPLVDYCRRPRRSADRKRLEREEIVEVPEVVRSEGAVPQPWERQELLRLPFDQYQRHRLAAEVLEVFRESRDSRLCILDVGGAPSLLKEFLNPFDSVVTVDRQPGQSGRSVIGDATSLPLADDSCDVAVSLDTLEHLPQSVRLRAIDECVRVARLGVVLSAPFASMDALVAEHTLFDFIKNVLGVEQLQLREHSTHGLPDLSTIEEHLATLGHLYSAHPSGYIHRWLAMMLLKHYVLSLADSQDLHQQIDYYYNSHYYAADQRSPSYRQLILISKRNDNRDIRHVERMYASFDGQDTTTRGDLDNLARLALLLGQSALHGTTVSEDRAMSLYRQKLAEKDSELQRLSNRKLVKLLRVLDTTLEAVRGERRK